jgi:hypothetical protein
MVYHHVLNVNKKLPQRLYFRACGEEEQLLNCVKISHITVLPSVIKKSEDSTKLPFISVSQFVVPYSETVLPSGKCRQCEGIKCMVFVVHLYSKTLVESGSSFIYCASK